MKTTILSILGRGIFTVLFSAMALPAVARAQGAPGPLYVDQQYGQIPLDFESNVGQAGRRVRYLARGGGYTMYFGRREVVLALSAGTNQPVRERGRSQAASKPAPSPIRLLRVRLDGVRRGVKLSAEGQLKTRVNYLIGTDPSKWRRHVPVFSRVRYRGAYPGVDLLFYGNHRELEYDFVVSPHADARVIRLSFAGAKGARVDGGGNLILSAGGTQARFRKPVAYQIINGTRRRIRSSYRLEGNTVDFELGAYDKSQTLVIDPVLSYSTFLGGGSDNSANAVAVDAEGNAYIAGYTTALSSGVITPGAFQQTPGGGFDGFVAKLNSTGTAWDYVTYLGGGNYEDIYSLAVDPYGCAYVGGVTYSANFPTKNPLESAEQSVGTYGEGFLTKLTPDGSGLVYSTYLGPGAYQAYVSAVAADGSGNAYVTGYNGFGFTTSTGACNVVEVNSNGTSVLFSTWIGKHNGDAMQGTSIALDSAHHVYIGGLTQAAVNPTANAPQKTFGGGTWDGFVTELSADGRTNLFSTYLGGSGNDFVWGVGVDSSGNIYAAGRTASANFPIANALESAINGGANTTHTDGFISKMAPDGTLLFSTFLGGSNNDDTTGMALQPDGDVVIVGQTGSTDFAPYINYGSINNGAFDGFIARLNGAGTTLMNFAYLGGTKIDWAGGVALDSQGNAYVGGATASSDFPITSTNVAGPAFTGGTNAYVTKLYFEPNQLGTKVIASWADSAGWPALPTAVLAATNAWAGASGMASVSSNGVSSLASTRFQRGAGYDPTYTSFVIPLDFETGVRLDDLGDNAGRFGGARPWFTRLQSGVCTHLSLVSSVNGAGVSTNYYDYVTNFDNPIAAFGASAGGSPLYLNERYRFGIYCGEQYESAGGDGAPFQTPLRILVYRLSDFVAGQTNRVAPIATNTITLPRRTLSGDQSAWDQFATNGFSATVEADGLRTTVTLADESGGAWGVAPRFANARSGTYVVTEEATTNAGYGYVLEGLGVVPLGGNVFPLVTNSSGGLDWEQLYALDFELRPPWRSVFIDQPQFEGTPLPSFYQGKSPAELTNLNAVVTNVIALTGGIYTNLDDSPELRRSPILDQLVSELNNDPMALANYVLNRIQLTDALAYSQDNGEASAAAVNEGGVNRDAQGVYLEGEGSPVEQCALLVYLLRQAGYPAAYVFPTNNNVLMLDSRLSDLLRMQLHGALTQNGQTYTTNSLIAVNYPWVVTSISNQCVQIFPWLKDTEVVEGLNLYDYMPTNDDNGFKWLRNYLYGDTNILSLSQLSDAPSVLFPAFVKEQLLANAPGISLDDIGVRAVDRQHYYSRWQDFPTPSVLTNQSQVLCVDSLSSPALTNVAPGLTNIFNTVSITIYSQDNTNTQMTVGPLRMADLENREMFVATNGEGNLMLWLAPSIAGNTNQSAFDASDPALTNTQVKVLVLSTNDTQFAIRMTHYRHQSIAFQPSPQYLGVSETLQFTTPDRPFNLPDITAICFNLGRVTPAMMDVHAAAYQNMVYQWQLNTNATPAVQDYQGAAAYLMGMDYYAQVSQFLPVDEQLHKVQVVSWFAEGLSKLTPVDLGAQRFMRPSLDMFFSEMARAGNGTSHPDSGNDPLAGTDDFSRIFTAEIAAEEHGLLNGFYQTTNSVSSVLLLRLAQQRATNNVAGIIELNKNNYQSLGNTPSAGYGPTRLKDYDPTIWASVTNAFQGWDADYVRAYITPGPVSVQAALYRGMGLVIVGKSQSASIISVNMNGVLGQPSPYFADQPAALSPAYAGNLQDSSSLDASATYYSYLYSGDNLFGTSANGPTLSGWYWTQPDWQSAVPQVWPYVNPVRHYATAQGPASFTAPSQVDLSRQINDLYALPSSTPPMTSLTRALDSGNTGLPTWKNRKNYVFEPVNVMSGEFYHDAVDLTLAGPQPLQLRRNYSSQNEDDQNGFGYGWDMNMVPYLGVTTNATTNIILTAVDLDGSVIAYRQQSNNPDLYVPMPQDNPQLDNFGAGRIGSVYNPFSARIVHSFSGTNETYTLTQADGQVRTYVVNSFPVYGTAGTITRQRPYLTTWRDTQGNTWTFSYGTDPAANGYGSLLRVQCGNGNYLELEYNAAGYVTDAFTGDGQHTSYEYDDFGDLVHVTRADASQESYEYQHTQYTNNNVVYVDSTHLLVRLLDPDGRLLQNVYDNQRRVVAQLATVGSDLNLYTNATFYYSNNFVMPMTNPITGYTLTVDVNGNTNRYDYTNGLVTRMTDPLNQTIEQDWYPDDATPPGYPRSPCRIKDKRGLWTQFEYDANGNVTNTVTWGDLTGEGTVQYATNSTAYDSNNLPTQITDAVGNSLQIVYDSQYPFLPHDLVRWAGAIPVSTNEISYGNVTNVVVNGNLTLTNVALGLPFETIRAAGSPDAATNLWTFDGRGFVAQSVQYTGNSDPALTNTFYCNDRGEVVEVTDAAGGRSDFDYDAFGRPISAEVFDTGQPQPLFWRQAYYDGNGELVWTDGPRSNPGNYVWRDYDGAGRLTTEIRWRAEARADGTGLEAPSGYNLFAQRFYEHDLYGNLILAVDPRGATTTNTWDALGRLVQRRVFDVDGATLLSSEGFGYEPGGEAQYYTNALGGVTTTLYTSTGQPEFRSYPDGSTNAWRYYLDGRLKEQIRRNGAYWLSTYDDADRITTRVFYSPSGIPEATNSIQRDRRGNVAVRTDADGNSFTNVFDGLDRLKATYGPVIATVTTTGEDPDMQDYVTNYMQQAATNYFDVVARVTTNVDALGDTTVTYRDALGRPTRGDILSPLNSEVRETTLQYSADDASVTVTRGTGNTAVSTTTYTDNDGQPVLTIGYPTPDTLDFIRNQYDLSGNLIYQEHDTSSNSMVTPWTIAGYACDGLNRLRIETNRDNAVTFFNYDPAGDLTNRVIPGGVQWDAVYNNASQRLRDWMVGTDGSSVTRSNNYTYYPIGTPDAGLLETRTEPRGLTASYSYDDWLRVTNIYRTNPDGSLTTSWAYDTRGFATNITEVNPGSVDGASPVVVSRTFDPYGQLTSEQTAINGAVYSSASQGWDAAGRRTMLSLNGFNYGFGWLANGALSAVATPNGSASYAYDLNGLLSSRAVGPRLTTISRDGEGRPLAFETAINTADVLHETLSYTGDGLIASDSLADSDFDDSRSYAYAPASRRLIQEALNLNGSTRWTNQFVYDNGMGAGPGILTQAGQTNSGSADWTGGSSIFSRVVTETNSAITRLATGRINGQASVSVALDGRPLPVTIISTSDPAWTNQWRAMMELTPGAHQLSASATTPNGFFTTNASVWFTNSTTHQTASIWRDNAGNVTEEIWLNADGSTNRVDQMWWDARERLYMMAETLGDGSGYLWFADYDGLNRRVRTHWNYTTNGIIYLQPKGYVEVDSQYDPDVEFLELGVTVNGQQTFKVCGPDLNGAYGGMNGTGGLDATVANPLQDFSPTITDSRGDILGEVTNGVVNWFSTRPTAYGAVPGYRPVPLGMGGDLAQSAAWRGRPAELNGWVNLGARLYDPEAGMFVSYDSGWNDLDPGSVSFSAGDPVNYFDPAGRIGKNGNAALSGDYLVLDQNFRPVGSYSAYDAYYLGGQDQAMRFSLRHNPLLGAEMGVDAPVNAFGGRSFRMVFGNEAAGFADFALNMDTAPLGMLNEVAQSSQAAGTASVTRRNRGFAYTRATVAVLGAGMMLVEPAQSLAEDTVSKFDTFRSGDDTLWKVGRHGDMPSPRPEGYQSHHGVNSVWMEANFPEYRESDAPAILMKNDPFHNATRGVFNRIRSEIAARQGVSPRDIDWSKVSPGTAWRIAEEQFRTAGVPESIIDEYFIQFNLYLKSLK